MIVQDVQEGTELSRMHRRRQERQYKTRELGDSNLRENEEKKTKYCKRKTREMTSDENYGEERGGFCKQQGLQNQGQ
jgi:hypothetical protein